MPVVQQVDARERAERPARVELHIGAARLRPLRQRQMFVVGLVGRGPALEEVGWGIEVLGLGAGIIVLDLVVIPRHEPRERGMR